VLEIGVSTGNTLRVLDEDCPAAALIVGIDLCAEGLGHAPRRRNMALVEDAPSAVPRDVLEHIDDDLARLCRVRALTTQGGRLLLTVPGHKALEPVREESHHFHRYEPHELRDRITRAGFSVEYLTPFMAPLYSSARASRWLSGRAHDVPRGLRIGSKSAVLNDLTMRPVINGVLAFMLRQEAAMLRRRVTFPIGTSLLAAARAGVPDTAGSGGRQT
jgi:hypothetical protein